MQMSKELNNVHQMWLKCLTSCWIYTVHFSSALKGQSSSWDIKSHAGQHEPSRSSGTVPQEHEIPHHTQPHRQHAQLLRRGNKHVCACVCWQTTISTLKSFVNTTCTCTSYINELKWTFNWIELIYLCFGLVVKLKSSQFYSLLFSKSSPTTLSGPEALRCQHSCSSLWHHLW